MVREICSDQGLWVIEQDASRQWAGYPKQLVQVLNLGGLPMLKALPSPQLRCLPKNKNAQKSYFPTEKAMSTD